MPMTTGNTMTLTTTSTPTSPALTELHSVDAASTSVFDEPYVNKSPSPSDTTFLTSQACTAVSIDTRTAPARFIGQFCEDTRERVYVPPGFLKPPTRTCRNPYPWVRVRVDTGRGTGSAGKPQGYPCQSLTTPRLSTTHPAYLPRISLIDHPLPNNGA